MDQIKPLVVVLVLAWSVFWFARPIVLQFMDVADFQRRRMVWLALTCAAFLAPNLWLFAVVALPLVYWAGSKDPNPTALYLFIFVTVPPASIPIPLVLVNQLFELSPARIVSLALLLPAAARLMRSGAAGTPGIAKADLAVIGFGVLQIVLYMPYEAFTNTLRRTVLYGIDTWVLYYVFSRGTLTKAAMRDTLASLWLACSVLVPVVLFESTRNWLLYTGIPDRWGVPNKLSWLFRDGVLRAQGPGGHSLTMGFLLAIGFGVWLYIGNRQSKGKLWLVGLVMWAALFATYSRAPWVVAGQVMLFYVVLSPAGRRHLGSIAAGVAAVFVALSLTPFGARIIASLPFVGTAEQGNVDYRQQVAEVCWRLIKQNPFFGDVFATRYMEELRQGQGIIDLVNTYASIGVFNGLVGVTLFSACFAYPMLRTLFVTLRSAGRDADDLNLGALLFAAMAGTLVMMATSSFGGPFEQLGWALAGMCSAYPALAQARARTPATSPARAGWSGLAPPGKAPAAGFRPRGQ